MSLGNYYARKVCMLRKDMGLLGNMMDRPPFKPYLAVAHVEEQLVISEYFTQSFLAYPIIGPDKLDENAPVAFDVTSERLEGNASRLVVEDVELGDGVSKETRRALVASLALSAFKMGHEELTVCNVPVANYDAWYEMGFVPKSSCDRLRAMVKDDVDLIPFNELDKHDEKTDMSIAFDLVTSRGKAERILLKPLGHQFKPA